MTVVIGVLPLGIAKNAPVVLVVAQVDHLSACRNGRVAVWIFELQRKLAATAGAERERIAGDHQLAGGSCGDRLRLRGGRGEAAC